MFDWTEWEQNRRLSPKKWLEFLRIHGARLVKADDREVVRVARSLMTTETRSDNAMLASLARELTFAREWAQCGFPQVVPSERLFANFAGTSIPAEALPASGLPWKCFVVKIPEAFYAPVDWGNGINLPAVYMQVRPMSDSVENFEFSIKTSDAPGAAMCMTMKSLGDVIDPELESMSMDWDAAHGAATGNMWVESEGKRSDHRLFLLALRRAFVGCMLEMESSLVGSQLGQRSKTIRPLRGAPKAWNFELRRPVVVDCRRWLQQLGTGETRRRLSVQILVRGHWKNQACGTGRTDRKFIHIEPYWRGPDAAPIAVRHHILKGSSEEPRMERQ